MSSETQDLNVLYRRIHEIEANVRSITSQLVAGQQSYETSVIPADYSHKHMPSSLLDGTLSSKIRFSNTITFAGEVRFADGTTYKIESDGDAFFNKLDVAGTAQFDTTVDIDGQLNFAEGTTYKVESDGDATFKDVVVNLIHTQTHRHTSTIVIDADYDDSGSGFVDIRTGGSSRMKFQNDGDIEIAAANLLMFGTGTDDERLRAPYLTVVPGSVDNGSLWMEADGLHGYLAAAERNLSRPHCLSTYIDLKARLAVWNIHGGILAISAANALDAVPTDINDTVGLGKILVVINAGGDVTGSITVTGTTVDRDTGAETGADTDTLDVDTLSTDTSGVDSGGNVTYGFANAYLTAKWFKGAVVLSTTNLTLTDVDIYQVTFEQFNDLPNIVVDTFDTTQTATNTAANIYWHLYSVKPSGDKVTILKESTMELLAAAVSANLPYRLRRGNLGISIDGTTQGIFVQCYPEPLANTYWDDINLKIWYT